MPTTRMFAAENGSKGTNEMGIRKKKIYLIVSILPATTPQQIVSNFYVESASGTTFIQSKTNVYFNLCRPWPSTVVSAYRKPHPCILQCHRSENVHRLLSATSIQIISLTKATVPRGADAVLFEVKAVNLPTRGRSLQSLII